MPSLKGCLLPDGILSGVVSKQNKTAMKTTDRTAAVVGLDVHRRFSTGTARNAEDKIAWRQPLEHVDPTRLRRCVEDWPGGIPVILESSFG